MGQPDGAAGLQDHLHNRKTSLAALSQQPEAVHISKAGYLWKRAQYKRTWLKRWLVCRKGVFRQGKSPGETSSAQERVLSGVIVSSWKLEQPVCRTSTHKLWGFVVEDKSGRRKTFYCDTEEDRDGWCWFFQNQAITQILVSDLYIVDWKNMLGSGYFAAVVRAWDKSTGAQVALKIMARNVFKDHLALLGREVSVMHAMGTHEHLLPLRRVMYAPQRLYLVTEYMDGGELAARCSPLQPYSEYDAARIARQVLSALAHLHALRICHTDIKPENILFASRAPDAPVKVIDFSLAVFFRQPAEPCGTPEFMAPELITNPDEIAKTGWGGEVDMWAFGILLYWMLSGRTPFEAATISSIFVNIETGRWSFKGDCWQRVSDDVKVLIRSLLRRNPQHRPTARALLKHPWIRCTHGHARAPSLDLTARGVHPVQEGEHEGRPRSAAGGSPAPSQAASLAASSLQQPSPMSTPLTASSLEGKPCSWASNRSVIIAAPSTPSSASDRTRENLCMIELPGSPTWSAEDEASPGRQGLSDDESVHDGPEPSPAIMPIHHRHWQEDAQEAGRSPMKSACSTPSSGDRRPHEVIAPADLHKVRGVTDLRRAIIQAEKDRSLPRIVQQARRSLEVSASNTPVKRHQHRSSFSVHASTGTDSA